jgi:hypothetical protein
MSSYFWLEAENGSEGGDVITLFHAPFPTQRYIGCVGEVPKDLLLTGGRQGGVVEQKLDGLKGVRDGFTPGHHETGAFPGIKTTILFFRPLAENGGVEQFIKEIPVGEHLVEGADNFRARHCLTLSLMI